MVATADSVARLAVWSGPRNISTAMMRSWENRPDTMVVDEPLYPHFLAVTDIDHPGRKEVLAVGECDWRVVVRTLTGPVEGDARVFYQKHMAHHLTPEVSHDWMAALTNVLLIRDPREVAASYVKARASFTADDIGLRQQCELYDEWASGCQLPPVIDATDFLQDPETYLRALCDLVRVEFTERMLRWPAGSRPTDGVWAPYWYSAVEASTGFAPYRPRDVRLDGSPAAVAEECLPYYERLHAVRWLP